MCLPRCIVLCACFPICAVESVSLVLLKVLIVFKRAIVSTPTESIFSKETICKVVFINLIFKVPGTVGVFASRFRTYFI